MKRKEGLYAVVGGCVGAVLTMVVSSFSPLGAQSGTDGHFDAITCRKLRVVNEDGTRDVQTVITPISIIVSLKDGRYTAIGGHGVSVYDGDMDSRAHMSYSGFRVFGGDGSKAFVFSDYIRIAGGETPGAQLTVNEHGGLVSVFGKGK